MNRKNVINDVIEVVAEVLELDVEEITADSMLVEDLGADSLDVVDLGFSLGKKFDIKMPQTSVIMQAEETIADMSLLVEDDRLTDLGAELLQQGPNGYSAAEVYAGKTLTEVFSETKVIHWANLCAIILQKGRPGDAVIADIIERVVSPVMAEASVA